MFNPLLYSETWEGIFLFALAIVLWRFKLYERMKRFAGYSRNGREILAPNFAAFSAKNRLFYNAYVSNRPVLRAILPSNPFRWISFAITIGWFVIMLLFTDFFSGKNILLLRVATGFAAPGIANGAGHYFVWVALFLVYMRYGGLGFLKGDFDFLKAGYTMAFFGAVHEFTWYLGYFVTYHISSFTPEEWLYYWPFLLLIASFIFGYALLFRNTLSRRRLVGFIAFIGIFYFLWVAAGFPITIDVFSGNTGLYFSPVTNMIEDSSWLLPALFLVL